MKVIDYKSDGNSFPIVIKKGKKKYLVKLRSGLCGEFSLLSEWFGNVLGKALGLNTRKCYWISLDETLKYKHIYIEVRDLIEKSTGINIAFEYFEKAEPFVFTKSSEPLLERFKYVYLLDVFLLNIDRTEGNINLFTNEYDQLIINDFDSSLLFNDLFYGKSLAEDKSILQCLKNNPFYQKIEEHEITAFISKINKIDFSSLIFDLPESVLIKPVKQKLLHKLNIRKVEDWKLKNTLAKIDLVNIETEEEKNRRTQLNREKLEKLVNSTR